MWDPSSLEYCSSGNDASVEAASAASFERTSAERLSRDTFSLEEIVFRISFLTLGNPSRDALESRVDWFNPRSSEIAFQVFPAR